MSSEHDRGLGRFLTGTAAVGLAISALAWYLVDDLVAAGVAAVLFGIAELLPARIRDEMWGSLSGVVILTAILLGGPLLGVCAAAGFAATWHVYPRRPFPRTRVLMTLFNLSQTAITAALAGLAFAAVTAPIGSLADLAEWSVWIGLVLAAGVYTVVNHLFVAVAIHFSTGEPLGSAFGGIVGTSMFLQAFYAGLAALAAALWIGIGPVGLVFLVIPALVARQGLLAFQREEESYDRLVSALLKTIQLKDGYTADHTGRVSQLCVEVAREFGFDYEQLRAVRYAAKLHDVGKLGVPSAVINKPGSLDEDEFALIKKHPDVGARILGEIDFLVPALDGVLHHHERVDGAGYPHKLRGEEIPLLARIITACDAFDAMTSSRSYRKAMEVDEALAELQRCAGTQFDPDVVEVLSAVVVRLGWEPTREFSPPSQRVSETP